MIIHMNNPTSLIYTVSGRPEFFDANNQHDKMVLDFKFYEICTITVFAKIRIEDDQFRVNYLHFTRDAHRSFAHSTFILIPEQSKQNVVKLLYSFELHVSNVT